MTSVWHSNSLKRGDPMANPEDHFDHIEIIAEFNDEMPSKGPRYTLKEGEGIVGITHLIEFTDSGAKPAPRSNGTSPSDESKLPDPKS
jgi:hypothetical protein